MRKMLRKYLRCVAVAHSIQDSNSNLGAVGGQNLSPQRTFPWHKETYLL